jgi:hypothetical protein
MAGAARADDAPASGLGGYTLLARANPLQITYDSPGLLPVSPIVQVSVPESYATLSTGPTGYSLSSLAFPGPLIADLASALKQSSASCQPPFPLPTYPLRSEAFFPQGPTSTDVSPTPGSRMHAAADGATSEAFSAYNDLGFPGVFSIGSISGTSSTSGTGKDAITKARSVVQGFKILAGAISFDSVTTDITATSSGDTGTTQGTTTVGGAKVGTQQVTIDENGVSLSGKAVGGVAALLKQLGGSLNDALVQSGITIKLVNHNEHKDGGLAERVADGLVIDIKYNGRTTPVISQLLGVIPTGQLPAKNITECAPSSPQGLVNLLKETHIESFALGAATVSSNASGAFVLPPLDLSNTVPGLPDLSSADLGASTGDALGAAGSTVSGATSTGAAGISNASASTGVFAGGRGVPVALILVLLALFPFLGAMTQRMADAALAAPAGTTCPLEEGDDADG